MAGAGSDREGRVGVDGATAKRVALEPPSQDQQSRRKPSGEVPIGDQLGIDVG